MVGLVGDVFKPFIGKACIFFFLQLSTVLGLLAWACSKIISYQSCRKHHKFVNLSVS